MHIEMLVTENRKSKRDLRMMEIHADSYLLECKRVDCGKLMWKIKKYYKHDN